MILFVISNEESGCISRCEGYFNVMKRTKEAVLLVPVGVRDLSMCCRV